MKYLLDTNIVSELMKETPDPAVIRWISEHDADTALCSIVMAEIAAGIEKMTDGKKKSALLKEVRFIIEDHSERTLTFDQAAAWDWARYIHETRQAGFAPPLLDSQIAAIARSCGLTIVTRNEADFPLMSVVNPFEH